jgi:hypothetical protein
MHTVELHTMNFPAVVMFNLEWGIEAERAKQLLAFLILKKLSVNCFSTWYTPPQAAKLLDLKYMMLSNVFWKYNLFSIVNYRDIPPCNIKNSQHFATA